MPILAPEALQGFSNASNYDKYRPTYPNEAVSKLLSRLGVEGVAGARIIDVGAGTGKFTSLLADREEKFEIKCIEPHDEMKEVLAKKFGEGNEGKWKGAVQIVEGDAANMSVEDECADAVIASQVCYEGGFERNPSSNEAWRSIWCYNNSERDGRPAATKWEQTLKDIIEQNEDGSPRFRHMKWKQVFEDQLDTTPLQTLKDTFTQDFPSFSLPLGEETVRWTVWLDEEAIWNRFNTLSHIAVIEGERKEQIKKMAFEAFKGDDVKRNEKGEIEMHGKTYFAWTSRI
ncbi:methyltransferase protein [Rutstroemia sp. NJR-2017a BVV2]|nr:methyltransferase protein [Rutstroemia sp. NJR-2017a BVV2]